MDISLNGEWLFKGYLGEDWAQRRAFDPASRDRNGWMPATVPGSVIDDLWKQGEVPDPYVERNSRFSEWAAERSWAYKRSFHADDSLMGKRIELRLTGVDYEAGVYLNGEYLGRLTGMFTAATYDVSSRIRFGQENWIAAIIAPAPREQAQVGRTSLVRTHKTRMNYGWDFCPRLVHQGIWQDVSLHVSGPVRIEDVFVQPLLANDNARAEVTVTTTVTAAKATAFRLETGIYLHERQIAEAIQRVEASEGQSAHVQTFTIEAPALWWPNGYGDQPLYEARIKVASESEMSAQPSDERTTAFGIRRIEFTANEGADASAMGYTLAVNGQRVYIKGWNWVPIDALYGVERPEKQERLFELARRAHVNLLRVWGGGLIEKEAFYDLCDRMGILVWQEFILSSSGVDNAPSEDPEYVAMLTAEARQIIPQKRNHPCLALWCGGNELHTLPDRPLDEGHAVLRALRSAVQELDPGRNWLPTSPSGPCFSNSLAAIALDPRRLHDVHGPWEHQGVSGQAELYNQGSCLLHSEFGVEGITNPRALDHVIAPDHQWPVSLTNPAWQHLGGWWVKEKDWKGIFGELEDIETTVKAIRFSQADGLRYAVEADRRRKYRNSGTLPWQFNESYPMAASTSAVDYFAQPKPAYYAVAQSYEPVHVSAKFARQAWKGEDAFRAEIWAANSNATDLRYMLLKACLRDGRGKPYQTLEQRVTLRADASHPLGAIRQSLAELPDEVFFLELRLETGANETLSCNTYAFSRGENLAPLLRVGPTRLEVNRSIHGETWQIQLANRGEHIALFVWLEDDRELGAKGGAFFDQNHLCIFPGEEAAVTAEWTHVDPNQRRITIHGWNTAKYAMSQESLLSQPLQPSLIHISPFKEDHHGTAPD